MPCTCGSSNRIMLESDSKENRRQSCTSVSVKFHYYEVELMLFSMLPRYNKSQVSTSELSMTPPIATQVSRSVCDNGQHIVRIENQVFHCSNKNTDNDPSAGSPTETLLRLLLPLDVQVWSSFRPNMATTRMATLACPKTSLKHPIGSSDGRCVQRAGT
ncbi:cdh1-d [Dermatophagoides farinae]|uniref:Cdh1-d n=1 Tax=Dermatophagoides farinae TaxID=6954 RepID=A0A9D4SF43_DERFA|nr:cdh1-d [Dermatophagoides farinae]